MNNQPIIAIATPHGSGGVGIIRISGQNLENIIQKIFSKKLTPRYAHLLKFLDKEKQIIDQVIAIYYKSPNSYTGEDILEIQAHGNMIVLDMIMQTCLELNKEYDLRIANAGEFTQRAFLNGKIDLIQAESVIDIINANSQNAVKSANQSLQGEFSKTINNLVEKIINLRILVESSIDFPEEDLDYSHMQNINTQFNNIIIDIENIQNKATQGYILNKGILICLVGEPNVGKSSLINALSKKEIAIVTPIAGTTRDKITSDIQIDGVLIKLIDTAGLRDTNDSIEEIGIQKTWEAIKESNIILYIQDINENSNKSLEILNIIHNKYQDIPIIKVFNKIDLYNSLNLAKINKNNLFISAKNGYGLNDLKDLILKTIGYKNNSESIFLARKRHLDALQEAKSNIILAFNNFKHNLQIDIIAEELRLSQNYLNNITGIFTSDDLLGKIFNEFCIGK